MPCCAPDGLRKKHLGYFGNVMDPGGLDAIWHSEKYRTLVGEYKDNTLCKTCHMRK